MATKTMKIGLSTSDKATMSAAIQALVNANIASTYSTSSTYAVGDYVLKDGVLYRCKTAITTAESWTSGHWEAAKVADIVATYDALINGKLSKGDYDGTTGVGYADNADQLNSPDFTTDQAPYLYRTSGGDADIGNREKDTIVGGSFGWNQLIQNGNFATTSGWVPDAATFSVSDNIGTLVASAQDGNVSRPNIACQNGHKIFVSATVKLTTATDKVFVQTRDNDRKYFSAVTTWQTKEYIASSAPNSSGNIFVNIGDNRSSDWDAIQIKNVMIIDLTTCFGPTIADYIYSLETATAGAGVAWFKKYFPKPYYPYKAIGGFLHVKLISHDMVGFNQWNGVSTQNSIDNTTGLPTTSTIRCLTGFIRVLPSTTYYFMLNNPISGQNIYEIHQYDDSQNTIKNVHYPNATTYSFTTSAFCHYIRVLLRFTDNRTTVPSDWADKLCINLSWSGWRNGQYEAHKKVTYPLDTSVILRGIPKLDADNNLYYDGDRYKSTGKVTRKYGIVDLSTLSWTYSANVGSNPFWHCPAISGIKPTGGNNETPNLSSAQYQVCTPNNIFANNPGVTVLSSGKIAINNGSSTTQPTGYLIYELAEPTEETADPFQETQEVDDFGTEEYVVPEQDGVSVPVGHYTKYPENLRDKLRRLPNMPTVSESTTATYAVNYNGQTKKCSFVPINDWLVANGYPAVQDLSSQITAGSALTIDHATAYKIGNVVNLCVYGHNDSGSAIPVSDAALFTIGASILPTNTLVLPVGHYISASRAYETIVVNINKISGVAKNMVSIPNGGYIYINVSYAVA